MPSKKRIATQKENVSSSLSTVELELSSDPSPLLSLPSEILLSIFKYVPHQQLAKLNHASTHMTRALKILPFLSVSQVIDRLYQGDLKQLFAPFLTDNIEIVQQLLMACQTEKFSNYLKKSRDLVETCRALLVNSAGINHVAQHWISDKLEDAQGACSSRLMVYVHPVTKQDKQRDPKQCIILPFASPQVFELLTNRWPTSFRFMIAFRGGNIDTALTMLLRFYDDGDLKRFIRPHIDLRSVLLEYPETAVRLICKLIEGDLDSSQRTKMLAKIKASQNLPFVLLDAFHDDLLPLKNPIVQVICWMFLSSSSLAATKLVSHPDVDPSIYNSLPLFYCLKEGAHDLIMVVLDDDRVDPSAWQDEALLYAVRNGYVDLTRSLLKDPRVSYDSQKNEAIKLAATLGHVSIFEILLEKVGNSINIRKSDLLMSAVKSNQPGIVRVLLQNPKTNVAAHHYAALKHAVQNDHVETVLHFLNHEQIDLYANNNEVLEILLFESTVRQLKQEVLYVFLHHPKTETALVNGRIFLTALLSFREDALQLVFRHPKLVIPKHHFLSVVNQYHVRALERLLESGLIDPSIDDNEAFIVSVRGRFCKKVELLLTDCRVDPSARNNAALRIIFKWIYKTEDLELMHRDKTPMPVVYSPHLRDFRRDTNFIGRLLIQHPKVQQKLAQQYSSLSDPSVYAHLFSEEP